MKIEIQTKPPITEQKPKPAEKRPIPSLRKDIQIIRASNEVDGSPLYNLYDPVKAKYYRISWAEALIFEALKPGMSLTDLAKAVNKKSTLNVNEEGLKSLFLEAERYHLLETHLTSEDLSKEVEANKSGVFTWLIYHYLYFQVPLLEPDNFLQRTLKYVKPLVSPWALAIYAFLIVTGLFQLISRFEEYLHTFTYFFNFEGIIAYGLAIMAVKIIHEFSHAYTAKNYHIYVPKMGIAFIVFWPVLYTDVTDSWKLSNRNHRLCISGAGIAAELVLAGVSTWGWVLSTPGIMQSVFFLISSVTWVSSLLVNLNPVMRFDGYYLLSDLWGIDNLQLRCFAMARWKLRKFFLGINMSPPEDVSNRRMLGMVVYSIVTWLYRLSLYTVVAVFVFFEFTKALGIVLFFVEIGVFIVWPIIGEVIDLIQLRKLITVNVRSMITLAVLSLLTMWFVIPLPHKETFSAVTVPQMEQVLYVPYNSIVKAVYAKRDQQVTAGQLLVQLFSKQIDSEIDQYTVEAELRDREMVIDELSKENLGMLSEKKAEVASARAQIEAALAAKKQLSIKAAISGTLYYWDDGIAVNQAIAKDTILGKIAKLDELQIKCFVPERNAQDLSKGLNVFFVSQESAVKIPGVIINIVPVSQKVLDYPQLASTHGGDLPVLQSTPTEKPVLIESFYQVDVILKEKLPDLKIGQLGYIELEGPWKSKLVRAFEQLETVIWRESSL